MGRSNVADQAVGSTHWSTRSLARAQSVSTIHRVWQDHGLKPHLRRSLKLSRDLRFLEKLTNAVGVYLTPPQKRDRAVCRRKESGSGTGSRATHPATQTRPMWHLYRRLPTPRIEI